MSDLDAHADTVADFYKRLKEAGVEAQVAGVCTIDLNKVLLTRTPPDAAPTADEQRAAIKAAAERKAQERADRRAAAQ